MSDEKKRLFFAVNLPEQVKKQLAEKMLPQIPKEQWRKVLPENLHITMHFLGYLPKEAVAKLMEQAKALESFESFEAEI